MTTSQDSSPDDAFAVVLHALTAVVRKLKFLVLSTLVVGALAAVGIILLPQTYSSSTTLLINESKSMSNPLSALKESGLSSLLGGMGEGNSSTPTLRALLETRALSYWAVANFRLDTIWVKHPTKPMNPEDMTRRWEQDFSWDEADHGGFEFSFVSPDPELSRKVVAGVSTWLDSSYRRIAKTSGEIREEYLDHRLNLQRRIVDSLQDSIAAFQVRNRILSPTSQLEGLAKGSADLEIEAIRMDLQIRSMIPTLGADNSQIHQMQSVRDQTREASRRLLNRDDPGSLLKGLAPGVRGGIILARKQRELQIQSAIFGFLLQQKEQIALDISKDLPSLTVIDPPIVPKKRRSPPRRFLFEAVLFAWWLGCAATIVVSDAMKRSPPPESVLRAWVEFREAIGRRKAR